MVHPFDGILCSHYNVGTTEYLMTKDITHSMCLKEENKLQNSVIA